MNNRFCCRDHVSFLQETSRRKINLRLQVFLGTLCLLAFIPLVFKLPVSIPSPHLPRGVSAPPLLETPSPPKVNNRLREVANPLENSNSFGGVIDEGVQAAVHDSEERAKLGLIHQPHSGGEDMPHEDTGPHRKLLDGFGVSDERWGGNWRSFFPGGQQEVFQCDRSSPLTDVCVLKGDVRVNLTSGEIVLYTRSAATPLKEETIRPHPRKWQWNMIESSVTEFSLESVAAGGAERMPCLKRNTAPGVLFSVGAFCGGVFHDFNEVYLPLFETTYATGGDVVMLVSDLKGEWWWHDAPRRSFVGALTRHPIKIIGRKFDTDNYVQGVECFDQLTVGLFQHTCMYDEFGGAESRWKANSDVKDFAPYVRKGLKIPDPPGSPARVFVPEGAVPVVGIAQRLTSRKLKNFIDLLKIAKADGFKVVPIYFEHYSPEEAVKIMASLDVFVAVHGAGLSNICLMRPGGVVLQIMPYGEGGKRNVIGAEYKNFAVAMDAEYLEWSVPAHDSTIKDQYNGTDKIVTSPEL